eukprot:CAMPEP_0181232014 /NCGR_PEP_ID=MMETSP1096-20121128/35462_1 /TAXON_ID=156174 ORGANISM="Chrysochromulina ericina, Strain CCMP281" /NCGR_SAMPLE_ID=MMETSP1096 /ASSEMBLY_ACC=CAM_ASM_000453 /LENGTH=101 /DNA_ID=CAMNT_0023326191 /DNA_START=124 /DNA_END=429 /DNA_ORIENTATION=+
MRQASRHECANLLRTPNEYQMGTTAHLSSHKIPAASHTAVNDASACCAAKPCACFSAAVAIPMASPKSSTKLSSRLEHDDDFPIAGTSPICSARSAAYWAK